MSHFRSQTEILLFIFLVQTLRIAQMSATSKNDLSSKYFQSITDAVEHGVAGYSPLTESVALILNS